jgi:hypothetical protein
MLEHGAAACGAFCAAEGGWRSKSRRKYHPTFAGTHVLDLALVLASPSHQGPFDPSGCRIPSDKIFEVRPIFLILCVRTSLRSRKPLAACKHLLHTVVGLCSARFVTNHAHKFLGLLEPFGVEMNDPDTDALAWLFVELPEEDEASGQRLQRLLQDPYAGRLMQFEFQVRDEYMEELCEPTRAASGFRDGRL